jgi:hypothetical protein
LVKGTAMSDQPAVSFDDVAKLIGVTEPRDCGTATQLKGKTILFDGYGSLARPVSEALGRRGVSRFILTDPKTYSPESVSTQCASHEVGRLKVDVGAEQLQALGADVISFARDIHSVPEGVVPPQAIVITSVDNRRADIVSNRRAARMATRLIKLNVEPELGVAAVRAYDFRHQARPCVECQFGSHHYAAQRHPKSCDGSIDGRRTNSPRWLSQAAAHLAVLAALDLAADGAAAHKWVAHEWQYFPKTNAVSQSQLLPNRQCRWDHTSRWRNVVRLSKGPDSISLRELLHAADVAVDPRVKIRFCQQVALRGRCTNCRADVTVVRWIADLQATVGTCPSCEGSLTSIPFSVFGATSVEPLLTVLDQPLADWGVERFAAIEISRDKRCTTFLVDGT